ncbi:TetR/AcrR family transcriptional regulator [Streptomyces sp. MK5]|uniref:TetR/AcrR family transcriptional regulator n=1 Tax=Streptomyces sp. MK5 TaxID=3064253 RepID=UPI00274134F3|nr:TetR/AcrR family transcriptional regulator [Streptomyces sp. MK5]
MSAVRPARRRDSARTRQLLVKAAGELLAERGFERTTVRDIGERAGVDQALIARYFGGKTQLFIAVLRAEMGDDVPLDLLHTERLRELFERVGRRGPGPVFQAAVQRPHDAAVESATREELRVRMVAPLTEVFAGQGLDRPQLRAEVATAAFIGVLMGRSAGAFEELAAADPRELLPLVQRLLSH